DREPADLVGRLMLEPPAAVPAEVDAELEQLDLTALRTSARFGMLAAIAYLAFFPVLYWAGFQDTWYLITGPALCLLIIARQLLAAPHRPFVAGSIAVAANLAMFSLFAWLTSPVVIGPGPAIIMITLVVVHRRLIRSWLLALLTATAVLSPWLLEFADVLPRS